MSALEMPHEFSLENELEVLVAPYVSGQTLEQRLTVGPMPWREVAELGRDLCAGLARLHALGLVHDDVKPSNMVLGKPSVLIDFGFCREVTTAAQASAGTLYYLSPERAGVADRPIEATSDLFSMGVVLYEAASGKHPFAASSLRQWLHNLINHNPPPVQPPELWTVLSRLLEREPEDRYERASDAGQDFQQLLSGDKLRPRPRRRLAEPIFVGRSDQLDQLVTAWRRCGRKGELYCMAAAAGAGKSRLLGEFGKVLRESGACVWEGRGGNEIPWRSFSDIARQVARQAKRDLPLRRRLQGRLHSYQQTLLQIFPFLEEILETPLTRATLSGIPEIQQAILGLLTSLANPDCPARVVLEDQHWTSSATHDVIAALANLSTPGLLVVLTARPDELAPDSALLTLPQLLLNPLSARIIAELLESMAGRLEPSILTLIDRHAKGSPFAAAASLRGMVESGQLTFRDGKWGLSTSSDGAAAAGLEAAITLTSRLRYLPRDAKELLFAGAVLGRAFSWKLAMKLAELDEERAIRAVRAARDRWLVTGEEEILEFAHDLIRSALLEELEEDSKRLFHRRAAELADEADCFARSVHLDGAGMAEQALGYALNASSQALARYDAELAYVHLRIARQAWERADLSQRLLIAEGLGDVLVRLRRHQEAISDYDDALAVASRPLDRARVLRKKAEVEMNLSREFNVGVLAKEAYELLTGRALSKWQLFYSTPRFLTMRFEVERRIAEVDLRPEITPEQNELIIVYFLIMQEGFFLHDLLRTAWAFYQGWALATSVRPCDHSSMYLHYLAGAFEIFQPGGVGMTVYRRFRPLASQIVDHRRRGRALLAGAQTLWLRGDLEEALRDIQESSDAVALSGEAFDELTGYLHAGIVLYYLGRFQEAERKALLAQSRSQVYTHALTYTCAVWVLSLVRWGDLEAPEPSEASDFADSFAHLARGMVFWRRSQFLQAANEFALVCQSEKMHVPLCAWAWRAECLRRHAEVLPLGASRISALRSAWKISRKAVAKVARFRLSEPHAHREAGLSLLGLGQCEKAQSHLRRSLEAALRLKMPIEEALTRLAMARLEDADSQTHRRLAFSLLRERGVVHPFEVSSEARPSLSLLDRFDALLTVGRELAATRQAEQVLNRAREAVETLLRPSTCYIRMVEENPDQGDDVVLSRSLWNQALESRSIVVHHEEISLVESLYLHNVRSALLMPLVWDGRVLAMVVAHHTGLRGFFGEEEIRIARWLASQAEVALENIQANARSEALLQSGDIGIALLDAQGDLCQANQPLLERLGASTSVWERLLPRQSSSLRREWRMLFSGDGQAKTFETFWTAPKDAETSHVDSVLVGITRVRGTQTGVFSVQSIGPDRAKALISLQELERQLLAGELHDGVLQDLAALAVQLRAISLGPPQAEALARIGRAASSARYLATSLSGVMHRLRNPSLEGRSLRSAIQDSLRREVGELKAQIKLDSGLDNLDPPVGHCVFRIVGEALTNIRRHADARSVRVQVRLLHGEVRGFVEDDGSGFTVTRVGLRSYGLRAMRQRATVMGGRLSVRSVPGGGTRVRFRLPHG